MVLKKGLGCLVAVFFILNVLIAQPPVLKTPTAHTAWITGFDVSHNGKYVATASVDFTIKIWDYRTKKELNVLTGHTGSVNAVRFSPDDSLIISGSNDTDIRIWKVSTGECIGILDTMFNRKVNDVCFSPDGRLIAGCSNNSIGVMDVRSKKIIGKFGLSGQGKKIHFFPDGNRIACAESDSSLSVWSLSDSDAYVLQQSFSYKHGNINDFFISKDGKFIFSAVNTTIKNIRMHIVEFDSLHFDSIRFSGHLQPARAVCSGETDDVFYSMSEISNSQKFRPDIEIKKWSITKQQCIDSFYIQDKGNSIINNSLKLSAKQDLVVSNYQTVFFGRDNQFSKQSKIESRTTITNGMLDKGSHLIFTSEDGIIRNLNLENNSLTLKNTNAYFVNSRFSADGNKVGAIHRVMDGKKYNTYIIYHDLLNGKMDTIISEEEGFINGSPGLVVSGDGSLLAYRVTPVINSRFISDSAKLKIWDLKARRMVKSRISPLISDLKFLSDNKSYALCTNLSNQLFIYQDSTEKVISDSVKGKYDYYTHLVIKDSTHIICTDNEGVSIWNIATKKLEDKVSVFRRKGAYISSLYLELSKTKDKLLLAQNDTVRLLDLPSRKIEQTFFGDMGWVHQLAFAANGRSILTASIDNSIRHWDIQTGMEKYKIIFIDSSDWIIITPEGYYQCTPAAAKLLHYVNKDYKIITFEQLDIRNNRPDKVLEAMENKDSTLIESYKRAWEKRIKKLGIDTTQFREGYSVPECDFANRDQIDAEQKTETVRLHIKASDSTYQLERFNIWVNEVPIFGQRGFSIRKRMKNKVDTTIIIKLSPGINRIETSVTNSNGTESYRMPLYVNYAPAIKKKESLRFIGIGIDRFQKNGHNLDYSVKDIRDLSAKLKEKYGNDIQIDTLFNESVNSQNVKALKKQLQQTSVNDKVILAYSGHGLLSKDFDYYLSTYTVNFEKPELNGLPYEELENLLDSIPARRKLMLIDACHSGEVDKEEMRRISDATDSLKQQGTKGGKTTYTGKTTLGMKNSFELMQSLFVNVGKSTGATVISAAAGTQFALERGDLKNGVFTYSILETMNKYPSIKISELRKIVGERVEKLTNGLQKPTSRNETIASDWEL